MIRISNIVLLNISVHSSFSLSFKISSTITSNNTYDESVWEQVSSKFLTNLLSYTVLLCLDERLKHTPNSHLHIFFCHFASQVNLGVGHRQPNDGFNVTNSNVHSAWKFSLLSELHIKLLNKPSVSLRELWPASLSSVFYVLLQEICLNSWLVFKFLCQIVLLCDKLLLVGMVFHVRVNHKSTQVVVDLFVSFILHNRQHIKPRQNRVRQIQILAKSQRRVILSV